MGRVHKAPRVIWGFGYKKRQGDAPRLTRAAGPHGYRTSPCQYVLHTQEVRRWQNKKDRTFHRVGHGKGDGDASCNLGESQCARMAVKGQALGDCSSIWGLMSAMIVSENSREKN